MSLFKQMSNFVMFFNIFIFLYSIFISQTFGSVYVELVFGSIEIKRNISLVTIIVSLGVILLVSALSGINILGSGINDTGTRTIIRTICFISMYLIMGLFTITFLNPLGIYGTIIYAIMTIIYALGFMEKNSEEI